MKFEFMATGHKNFASFQASLGEDMFSFLVVLYLLIANLNFPFNPCPKFRAVFSADSWEGGHGAHRPTRRI